MHIDTSHKQTSGCPVHFLWDGKGWGRPLIRSGFLGFVVAGGLASASRLVGLSSTYAYGALLIAALLWTIGQGLAFLPARR